MSGLPVGVGHLMYRAGSYLDSATVWFWRVSSSTTPTSPQSTSRFYIVFLPDRTWLSTEQRWLLLLEVKCAPAVQHSCAKRSPGQEGLFGWVGMGRRWAPPQLGFNDSEPGMYTRADGTGSSAG